MAFIQQIRMRYILLLLVSLFIISCDNELDLVAEFQETPVVYGIVDQGDSIQYIRVERAFVDKTTSANTIAQNPDSLYYEDITVKLVRVQTGDEYTLERVNGNDMGLQRDMGVFATDPNYLYMIRTDAMPLIEEEEIEIKIEGIFEDRAVTAGATLLRAPFFFAPPQDGIIGFIRNRKVNVGWNPKGDPTVYSAIYTFTVNEMRDGITTTKKVDWVVERNTDKTILEIDGVDFYSFINGALEKDPNVTRTMGPATFTLIEGNETVADYIRVGQANIGITSSGEIPTFTNMSDGLGLFGSSISQTRSNLALNEITIDSLIMSPITADLNFER